MDVNSVCGDERTRLSQSLGMCNNGRFSFVTDTHTYDAFAYYGNNVVTRNLISLQINIINTIFFVMVLFITEENFMFSIQIHMNWHAQHIINIFIYFSDVPCRNVYYFTFLARPLGPRYSLQ